MARSDPTAWLVEVLEGPAAGVKIPLEGRALPFRPSAGGSVSFGTEQRTKLIWYPGNPVATQLVFGPTLPPTTINGVWQDRYLGEDQALDLIDLFTELSETGVQVRVLWGSLVYQGLVKKVDFQPGVPTGGLGDIAWSMVFEWNSRGGLGPRRVVGSAEKTLRGQLATAADLFGTLGELVQALVDTVETLHGLPSALAAPFRTQVEDLADDGAAALETLTTATVTLGTTIDPPRRVLEDADSALDRALDVSADTGQLVSTVFAGTTTAQDGVAVILGQYNDRGETLAKAFEALEGIWESAKQVADLIRPDALVLIRPVRGSDLRDYALLYYGDADLWARIAEANGIDTGSRVPDDVDELLVPLALSSALDDQAELE